MGFDVEVVVTLKAPPTDVLMKELDHHFEVAAHQHGSMTVELIEHVGVANEADAIAFVRSLVLEAIPANAVITSIVATAG
ncbi:MAG TPA: hypothetical protein PK020_08705 [Ilumatobacteraceae bacterium]|nr:hypothetical protein [Ilumatobacteraceae bacterium]HRB03462.1 hypothetical protein [Ilumatobacteraceae bacterium]